MNRAMTNFLTHTRMTIIRSMGKNTKPEFWRAPSDRINKYKQMKKAKQIKLLNTAVLMLFSFMLTAQTFIPSDIELIGFYSDSLSFEATMTFDDVPVIDGLCIHPFDASTPFLSTSAIDTVPEAQFGGGIWASLPENYNISKWKLENGGTIRYDAANSSTTATTECVTILTWPKSLLTLESPTSAVSLDETSVFTLGNKWLKGTCTSRFVIQNGDKYYISEFNIVGGTSETTLETFVNNSDAGKRWAEFDPSAFPKPTDLDGLTYLALTPDNVQSVGAYIHSYQEGGEHRYLLTKLACNGKEMVSDTPSVDSIPDQPFLVADEGPLSIPFTGVVPGPSATQIINASATSSAPDILPNLTVNLNADQTGGEIILAPTNNEYGLVTVTLTIQDDGGTADGRVDTVTETFEIEIVNPDLPSLSLIPDQQVFVGSGQSTVLIPDLSDGGTGEQAVTVTANSSDNSIVEVVITEFNSENTFGTLLIEEKGILGNVTITVTLEDPDGTFQTDFVVHVVPYTTYGMNWTVHDAVFWQENNVVDAIPNYHEVLAEAVVPEEENFDWDQFAFISGAGCGHPTLCQSWSMATTMLKGYIIPPETGNYIFYFYKDADGALWLSSDSDYANAEIIASKSDNHGNVGIQDGKTVISDFVYLEAGEIYAIYSNHWYVFHPDMYIEWETPSGTREIIGGENSYYIYDIEKPTAPLSLNLIGYSSNSVVLNWEESTDNNGVTGYNLYVNGSLWNETLIANNGVEVTGLEPDTQYSFVVSSSDEAANESEISNVINLVTYPVDNNNPQPPTNISAETIAPMAIKLIWDEAIDDTGIFGYNVYVDNDLYNSDGVILEPSVVVSVLNPQTEYSFEVEAIDASGNLGKSDPVTITTNSFDPLTDNLGVKTGSLTIEAESIGAFDGFGSNGGHGLGNNGELKIELLKDLNPSLLRWGTITVNSWSLSEYSGTAPFTVADFFSYSIDTLDAVVSFTAGVCETCDWITNENTFLHFLEYIAGDGSTEWGARRIAEGYTEPFLPKAKHLLFEFGNETWGSTHDVAPSIDTQEKYTNWAKEMETLMRSSPYYDPEKISFVYSGRNPDPSFSYGVNNRIFNLIDTLHMDYIGLGGYLSANVGDGGSIEGEGSDYYKNVFQKVANNVNGLKYYNGEMLNLTGEVKKSYLYETDCSKNTYFGRIGQALPVIDHGLENIKYGSVYPTLFSLTGGKWAMVSLNEDNKRMPKFILGKFINDFAIGQYLKTDYSTLQTIESSGGIVLDFKPVGTHVFANDTIYNIILSSRDYSNDHYVEIIIATEFNIDPNSLKYYVYSGESVDSRDAVIDTLEQFTTFENGMIVKVPKYSVVVLGVKGDNPGFNKPLGYVDYIRQESVTLSAETTTLNSNNPGLWVRSEIIPEDALGENINWEVISDSVDVQTIDFGHSLRIASVDANGSFTVRGRLLDDPDIYDEITFTVDLNDTGIINEMDEDGVKIYPNPVSSDLVIINSQQLYSKVRIYNISGLVVQEIDLQTENTINFSDLTDGLYIVEILGDKNTLRKLIVKE